MYKIKSNPKIKKPYIKIKDLIFLDAVLAIDTMKQSESDLEEKDSSCISKSGFSSTIDLSTQDWNQQATSY